MAGMTDMFSGMMSMDEPAAPGVDMGFGAPAVRPASCHLHTHSIVTVSQTDSLR
jgi:hypothetical protein